jgi:hypothetical protein
MPSIDFCNRMDPRAHLANPPNPAGDDAEALTDAGGPSPLRSLASRVFTMSGVARRSHAEPTPAQQPLAARIYPDSFDSDTPCRDADTNAAWKRAALATLRCVIPPLGGSARLGNSGRSLATTSAVLPLGPPSPPRHANERDGRLHPRCLPPLQPPAWIALPGRGARSGGGFPRDRRTLLLDTFGTESAGA